MTVWPQPPSAVVSSEARRGMLSFAKPDSRAAVPTWDGPQTQQDSLEHVTEIQTAVNTMESHYNVLFLCTGNSARSIMAEAIMNFRGCPRFAAYSAGSHPSGRVRPEALRELEFARIPIEGLRSKSWAEFSKPEAPHMDFVFTVCDNAANEVCPIWPGQPVSAHWGVPDPAAVRGTAEQISRAYRDAFVALERRISLFLSLPFASTDRLALKQELDKIGR